MGQHELRMKSSACVCSYETSAKERFAQMIVCFCGCLFEAEDGVEWRRFRPWWAPASDLSAKNSQPYVQPAAI
jgi:hypothetical protein